MFYLFGEIIFVPFQQSQTRHIMDQIKSTRDKADEVTEDLKNKISVHVQLAGELEKLNNNISR